MAKRLKCGFLFNSRDGSVTERATITIDGDLVRYAGPAANAPPAERGDEEIDYSSNFIMPGLVDVHTHLAYGNAKTEEDIDLYASMEFRTLRGLFFAQRVLAAGYTSLCAPGDAGHISTAIRDAIAAGLFVGPRVTAAGPYLTNRLSLTDWYPTWIGVPETAIARLVQGQDEALAEIRRQVKDGVDCIKIAMDGRITRPNGELVAAFDQQELNAMVGEAHRLGRKVIVHARGREAVLYSARAGVDLIFHASMMDDEGLDWVLKNKCAISPTLTFLRHSIDFTRDTDPTAKRGRREASAREFECACVTLSKAHKAGVPLMTGTDSGFAITPYGEWHAREPEIFVKYLGLTPAEALMSATAVSAKFLREGDQSGVLEAGRHADLVVLNGNPLNDISMLLGRSSIHAVYVGGRLVEISDHAYEPKKVSDFAYTWWTDLYTRDRVKELALK